MGPNLAGYGASCNRIESLARRGGWVVRASGKRRYLSRNRNIGTRHVRGVFTRIWLRLRLQALSAGWTGIFGGVGSDWAQTDTTLGYGQTYHINGWTILPSSDGTRFTNDGTGHGMFVSIENVAPF